MNKYQEALSILESIVEHAEMGSNDLNILRELVDRATPMKYIHLADCCPRCDEKVHWGNPFCSHCGQAIDWSDSND